MITGTPTRRLGRPECRWRQARRPKLHSRIERLGGVQLRVAILCALVQMCDGYDVNSVGWAVPSLIREWQLPPPAFAMAFLWSSVGIMVGALSAGPIGDRFGRRPLLLASLTIFGIASLLSAVVGSLGTLSLLQFFTGIGIGGGFSGAAALSGDYAPHRLRATMIMATFTGAPLGGFLGGQIVALLLAEWGWRMIFVLGGIFPLALLPVLVFWLPESPRFLAARRNLSPRNAALLRRFDITSAQSDAVDVARGNPIWMLFGRGYALQTALLWIIFFCSLLNLFLFVYWMPTVLNLIGISPGQAVIALFALPYSVLCVIIFLAGMTIIGSQTGVNGACGKLYPARMRTSGIGWALGIGRLGGIVAPILGGYLLAVGLPPTRIFLVACLFALIAAAATALLVFRNTDVEST